MGDRDDDEDVSILDELLQNLTAKFRHHAPPFVRFSLRTIFLGPLALLLALISLIAFSHLHRTHVPTKSFTINLELQYPAAPDFYTPIHRLSELEASDDQAAFFQEQKEQNRFRIHHPYGIATGLSVHLIPNQAYDVEVELVLPRSPHNADAGNFMIVLDLADSSLAQTSQPGGIVTSARVPAMMTYVPPFVNKLRQILKAPLLIVGFGKEEEVVRKTVLERVSFGKGKLAEIVPDTLRVEVQRQGWKGKVMEVSEARVEFTAGFSGLRYLLHAWPVTSFAILFPLFFSISFSTTIITLFLLSIFFAPSHHAVEQVDKRSESPDAKPIKREDESSSAFASGLSLFPASSSNTVIPGTTTETGKPLSSSGSAADGEESDLTLKVDIPREFGNGHGNEDSEEDDFVLGEAEALTPKGDGFGRGLF